MHSVVLFLFLLTSCAHLFTADKSINAKETYSISTPPTHWKISSNKNADYLLTGPSGASILMQSFCNEFQSSSLDKLAQQTFNSLDRSQILEQEHFMLHERSALKTQGLALIDGVNVRLSLINTKRNHCYYDFLEILPQVGLHSVIDEVIRGIKFR